MPTVAPPVSESAFQRAVLELARRRGWRTAHFDDSRKQVRGGRLVGDRRAAGFPDLVLVRDFKLLFVELKSEKGRASGTQEEWLTDLKRVAFVASEHVEVHLWRPSDWPQIELVLSHHQSQEAA